MTRLDMSTAHGATATMTREPMPSTGGHTVPDNARIVVLVPAHNEEGQIGATLSALARQTYPAAHIVVVSDNSTDRTAEIAAATGATVLFTKNNTAKKAGALNHALRQLLPTLDDDDVILVQDADSKLDDRFIELALGYVRRGFGGVGGVFRGGAGGGFVGHLQRNEYARYAPRTVRAAVPSVRQPVEGAMPVCVLATRHDQAYIAVASVTPDERLTTGWQRRHSGDPVRASPGRTSWAHGPTGVADWLAGVS